MVGITNTTVVGASPPSGHRKARIFTKVVFVFLSLDLSKFV